MNILIKRSIVSAVAVFSCAAPLIPAYAEKSACDAIKGKTYIFFMEGQFDDHMHAASSGKLTFDANAKGQTRNLYTLDLPSTTAGTGCTPMADGTATCNNAAQQIINVSCSSNSAKQGTFKFTSSGGDAGSSTFSTSNQGTTLWVVHNIPKREMSGWFLQLPLTANARSR